MKNKVNMYADKLIELNPFTLGESQKLLCNLIPGIEQLCMNPQFNRIISYCGGIPR